MWDALEAGRKRVDRFVVRPETEQYKVVDIWTGETAVIAMSAASCGPSRMTRRREGIVGPFSTLPDRA